ELGNEKTVSKLYRVNNNGELKEIEFTQEGSQIKFTLDSLMIEKIAIVYGSENMPIVKVERTAGDNRYLTAIEVSKKQFDKSDTVILA
uniref:cell wall-binding repeat-containing protein n=1 Tax=Streptomyces sp. GSL17-113 TaxID=3115365 RepID=UPI002E768B43